MINLSPAAKLATSNITARLNRLVEFGWKKDSLAKANLWGGLKVLATQQLQQSSAESAFSSVLTQSLATASTATASSALPNHIVQAMNDEVLLAAEPNLHIWDVAPSVQREAANRFFIVGMPRAWVIEETFELYDGENLLWWSYAIPVTEAAGFGEVHPSELGADFYLYCTPEGEVLDNGWICQGDPPVAYDKLSLIRGEAADSEVLKQWEVYTVSIFMPTHDDSCPVERVHRAIVKPVR